MNPLARCARLLSEVWASAAFVEPTPDPEPAPAPSPELPRVPVPYRLEPAYTTAFEEEFRRSAADEALVLERLAVETARVGSPWEVARRLFAPDAPCAGLYATQAAPQHDPRVFLPPNPHRPNQPLL